MYTPGNIPAGLNILLDTPVPLNVRLEPKLVPVIVCGKPSWHTTIGFSNAITGGSTVIIQVVVYKHPEDVVSVIVIVYVPAVVQVIFICCPTVLYTCVGVILKE
jgi:hypothetical protein